MSVQQISVFLESRPGHLRRVLDAFEDAHVSVRGYSASDTGDYGIERSTGKTKHVEDLRK